MAWTSVLAPALILCDELCGSGCNCDRPTPLEPALKLGTSRCVHMYLQGIALFLLGFVINRLELLALSTAAFVGRAVGTTSSCLLKSE